MIQYTSLLTQLQGPLWIPLHLSISSRFTFCASANRAASVDVASVASGGARWCRKRLKLWERTWSFLAPSSNLWEMFMGELQSIMVPSGKLLHNHGKSPFLMSKSTISMAIFNSKLLVYQRVYCWRLHGFMDSVAVMLANCWPKRWENDMKSVQSGFTYPRSFTGGLLQYLRWVHINTHAHTQVYIYIYICIYIYTCTYITCSTRS